MPVSRSNRGIGEGRSMNTLRLLTSALLVSGIIVRCANAQVTVRGGATNLPAQGTPGTTAPKVSGTGSSISPGAYGPGNYGGAYGPGNYGPGAYLGGGADPADTAGTGKR